MTLRQSLPIRTRRAKITFQLSGAHRRRAGIPVYAPDDVNHPLWVERIRALAPDVIFSFYYRNLICDEILGPAAKEHLTFTAHCCQPTVGARR